MFSCIDTMEWLVCQWRRRWDFVFGGGIACWGLGVTFWDLGITFLGLSLGIMGGGIYIIAVESCFERLGFTF